MRTQPTLPLPFDTDVDYHYPETGGSWKKVTNYATVAKLYLSSVEAEVKITVGPQIGLTTGGFEAQGGSNITLISDKVSVNGNVVETAFDKTNFKIFVDANYKGIGGIAFEAESESETSAFDAITLNGEKTTFGAEGTLANISMSTKAVFNKHGADTIEKEVKTSIVDAMIPSKLGFKAIIGFEVEIKCKY